MGTRIKNILIFCLAFLVAFSVINFAQATITLSPEDKPTNPQTFVTDIITWVLGVAGGLAVLMIVYSGVLMAISSGTELRKKGLNTLIYSVIGLIVIILSWTIVYLVTTIL